MKILFLVLSCKQLNHEGVLNIERVDLTRRLDIINTWGQDVLDSGNEIVFYEGGNEHEYYDDDLKTLYLTEPDTHDNQITPSPLFVKMRRAYSWALKNKEFDILFSCDDDVYVNLPEFLKLNLNYDFLSSGSYGGSGFFFSKKALEELVKYENTEFKAADIAIYNAMMFSENLKKFNGNDRNQSFYIPGELSATIHYASGKRAYHLHNIFKFYHENGYTNRKIILGGPLDCGKRNPIVSYETKIKRKTIRAYDFTIDSNNWEYHGGYVRSYMYSGHLRQFWPYAKKSTKCFVINVNGVINSESDDKLFYKELSYLIEKCEESLINEDNLFLLSENDKSIDGWIIDNDIKEKHKLTFELLNNCNFYRRK